MKMIQFLHLLISVVVLVIILSGDCVTSILTDGGSTCSGNSSTYTDIPYPFWSGTTNPYAVLRNSPLLNTTYVGYPGLLVNCEDDGRLTSNLSTTNLYYLRDMVYQGTSVTAVDVSVDGLECPQPRHNFSSSEHGFDVAGYTDNFGYSNYDRKISPVWIFYNCSSGYPEDTVQHLPCLDNSSRSGGGRRSFAFLEEKIPQGFNWYQNCEESVRVPVMTYEIMEPNYAQALRVGFQLSFYAPTVECETYEFLLVAYSPMGQNSAEMGSANTTHLLD